jgi:hypothetical protein
MNPVLVRKIIQWQYFREKSVQFQRTYIVSLCFHLFLVDVMVVDVQILSELLLKVAS